MALEVRASGMHYSFAPCVQVMHPNVIPFMFLKSHCVDNLNNVAYMICKVALTGAITSFYLSSFGRGRALVLYDWK